MKQVAIAALFFVFASTVSGALPQLPSVTSGSGRFVVVDGREHKPLLTEGHWLDSDLVQIEPQVLVISLERIRHAFFRELGINDLERDRVQLVIRSANAVRNEVVILSSFYSDGWRYRLEIPDKLKPSKLVGGIVHLLLLELANDDAISKCAEVPDWLTEGFTAQLMAIAGPQLVMQPAPTGYMLQSVERRRGIDPLEPVRQVLRTNTPLEFVEMSMPTAAHISGEKQDIFEACAHLFLHELLRLDDGKHSMLQMLKLLPHCWNWQTAFLQSFRVHFPQMLDVEKWWSLVLVELNGPAPDQVWSIEVTLEKLNEILTTPVQVRTSPDTLPSRASYSLQQVIRDLDFDVQRSVLQPKVHQLGFLRVNAPLSLVPIIDAYRSTLQEYLSKRALKISEPDSRRLFIEPARLLAQQALDRFNLLDQRQEELRRSKTNTAQSDFQATQ